MPHEFISSSVAFMMCCCLELTHADKQERADMGISLRRLKEVKQGELELELDWYSVLDKQQRR